MTEVVASSSNHGKRYPSPDYRVSVVEGLESVGFIPLTLPDDAHPFIVEVKLEQKAVIC